MPFSPADPLTHDEWHLILTALQLYRGYPPSHDLADPFRQLLLKVKARAEGKVPLEKSTPATSGG